MSQKKIVVSPFPINYVTKKDSYVTKKDSYITKKDSYVAMSHLINYDITICLV